MAPLLRLQLLLISLVAFAIFADVNGQCTVDTSQGPVAGAADSSNRFCSYMGIPFAAPPVGPLRFQAPQPAPAWTSPLNATTLPNWCPQAGEPPSGVNISEDCLYLNVYQPRLEDIENANLPVMIWFHGGSFTSGSSLRFTPEKLLARRDIILVVAHYRLGLLGFLSTGDDSAYGNYGLKDQSYAIRWVNENIQAFGGNSSQVTIFGESAGSASVMYQLISPLNKGLIQGVIAQSGAAIVPWAIDPEPAESARLMAARFNCPTFLNVVIVACLRRLDWRRIIEEQGKFTLESYSNFAYPRATMTPVVEPNHPGAFISEEPLEIMRDGDIDTSIPVMLGANKHDGSLVLATIYLARLGPLQLDQNPEYMRDNLVPDILKFIDVQENLANRAVASTFEMAYLSGVNRSSWEESMPGLVDIMTVVAFKSSVLHSAELLSKRGSDVYLYSFEHHSNNTLWGPLLSTSPVNPGIAHADDLMYLFTYPEVTLSNEDEAFSEIVCDMWLDFGSSGNPTPLPSDRYVQWPLYDAQDELYMKLNVTPTVMSDYRSSWRPNGFEWN